MFNKLNNFQHKIGKHPDGLCDICHTYDNVSHFLLSCKKLKTRHNLQKSLKYDTYHKMTHTNLLNSKHHLIHILQFIHRAFNPYKSPKTTYILYCTHSYISIGHLMPNWTKYHLLVTWRMRIWKYTGRARTLELQGKRSGLQDHRDTSVFGGLPVLTPTLFIHIYVHSTIENT